MITDPFRQRIRDAVGAAFGERLEGIVLYGSEARGSAEPDSDIDLLVLLRGPVDERRDSWACIESLYPLVLEFGRCIHPEPVGVAEYRAGEFPLYRNAQREGVRL